MVRGARAPDVVVALDFTPSAVHAPLYMAAHDGLDRARGIRIRIRSPASQPDALKLLAAGRIDVGILVIHDLGVAGEREWVGPTLGPTAVRRAR